MPDDGVNKRERMVLDVPRIDVKRNAARGCSAFEQSVCKSSKSVCACVFVCRYRASRKYILVPEVNVVASPALLLLSPLLLIHPNPAS